MQKSYLQQAQARAQPYLYRNFSAAEPDYSQEIPDTDDEISVCPGEGDRYGNFSCNNDYTHRVCAKLLDPSGQPLNWGS